MILINLKNGPKFIFFMASKCGCGTLWELLFKYMPCCKIEIDDYIGQYGCFEFEDKNRPHEDYFLHIGPNQGLPLLAKKINLTKFNNLEVLDIENNSLTRILVPKSLKELVINNNKLIELPININPIRLKANKNNLTMLPEEYTNIENLELSYNNITKINKKNKLRRLIIDSNPIEIIESLGSLTYLDISDTNQVKLNDLPLIKNLVANSTKLTEIPNFKTLEVIEVVNTPIKKIQFFENFDIILCSYNLTKNISSKFIDLGKAHIKVKNNNVICISREEIN